MDALQYALSVHRAGDVNAAAQLYGDIIRKYPREPNALRFLGVIRLQQGRLDEAEALIAKSLKLNDRSADSHYFLGRVFWQKGNTQRANFHLKACIGLDSRHEDATVSLGCIAFDAGQPQAALQYFQQAASNNAVSSQARYNLGKALHALQRYDEALASDDRAITLQPDNAEAIYRRGVTLDALGRHEAALDFFDRALQIRPDLADAHCGRAVALGKLGRLAESLRACESAIAADPASFDAWYNYGVALSRLRRFTDAVAAGDRAIGIDPNSALAHYNRAQALFECKRYAEALAGYERAIVLNPDVAGAYEGRAGVFILSRRYGEAIRDLRRAHELNPQAKFVLGSLVLTLRFLCDWNDIENRSKELVAGIEAGHLVSMPFDLLGLPSPALQRKCAEGYIADKYPAHATPVWRGEPYGHGRVRVAYLSADFRDHPVSYLLRGMIGKHDGTRFETFGLALTPSEPSEMRERMRGAFAKFIDASDRSDAEIAGLLRELEIDIAVDLMGHTRDARTDVFAARAVPIQVNFFGYAGTTGARYIDYLIADRIVIPEDDAVHYTEKVVYLPETFFANDDARAISAESPSRGDEGLPDDAFVFCSFNQSYKITPEIFDCWMRLLRAVEDSVLWLSHFTPETRANIAREAVARGVAAERVVFSRWIAKQEDHLARHRLADLFLDTPVYNAHSTAADALWAGLPVLTCLGTTFAGRVAASLLNAVGLPEMVTHSLADYEALALKLAREPAALADIKAKLARNRTTHPLFDTARFTRHLEAAYIGMWGRQQRGEPPASFAVEPIS